LVHHRRASRKQNHRHYNKPKSVFHDLCLFPPFQAAFFRYYLSSMIVYYTPKCSESQAFQPHNWQSF
jgi:hypothetical protein